MIGIGDGNAIAIDIATTTAVTSAIIVVTANVGNGFFLWIRIFVVALSGRRKFDVAICHLNVIYAISLAQSTSGLV